jgi:hypothetical protein
MHSLRAVGTDFAPAPRALALLQVVADFDADLARVGGEPALGNSLLLDLEFLENFVPEPSRARSFPTGLFEERLMDFAKSLQARLAVYEDEASSSSRDQIDPLRWELGNRYTRQLRVWQLLGRPDEALVDFNGYVDQVIASDDIRRDASSVKLAVELLTQQLRDHRDDIFNEVQSEIAALRRVHGDLAKIVATSQVAMLAVGGSELPIISAIRRRLRKIEQVLPLDAPVSISNYNRRIELEADLLETKAMVDQAVRGLIERTARGILSEYATNLRRTQLRLAATEGLAQVIDDRLEIRTAASAHLADLLTRMKGGSVGIAGPRGVGKSTIMRRFCTGREEIGDRPILPVMVPAPVVYDSRDFTLHLFAEVCRAAGAVPAAREPDDDEQPRWPGWRATAAGVAALWLPFLGLLLILAGTAGLVLATVENVNHLVVWGAAAMIAPLLLARPAFLATRGENFMHNDPLSRMAVLMMGARGGALLVFFIGGGVLLTVGLEGGHLSRAGVESVGLLAAGILLVTVAGDVRRQMLRAHERTQIEREGRPSQRGNRLVAVASVRLEELRYQQTFTSGVTGKLALPIGLELGGTSERSLSRHPMSFPEVVAGFTRFLALAAQTHDVLIAIDELDKLPSDDETANEFLNDIKAAFGVPNTYFLVSVSEDAMSCFERRGLPFRDVFDSTFDEIVYVEPLVLAEAQTLLSRRVVGLPYIYSALCHVLAGGVPRDLVRTARRIVEVNEQLGNPDELAPIVHGLMVADLKAKTNGVQFAATRLKAPDPTLNVLLEWLHGFRAASATRTELAAKVLDPDALMPLRVASQELDEAVTPGLLGLASELNAYGYFVATVLEFFEQQLTEKDVEMAADGARESPRLELLAQARMGFSVSAQTAWRGIEAFRSEANLDPPDFQAPPRP